MKCNKCGYDDNGTGDFAHVCGPIEIKKTVKTNTMKDFNGNELAIGDTVAVLPPNYRCMVKGKVIGFTPKQIVVEYKPYFGPVLGDRVMTTRRDSGYVAKIVDRTA